MSWVYELPHLNASLNGLAAVCQILGYLAIRKDKQNLHAKLMSLAFVFSSLFLISYLTYHFNAEAQSYQGPGRPLYLLILISHIILAVAVVPLVLRTFFLAIKNRLEQHKKFGRVTLAIWLYVSVTGVMIYYCIYYLNPQ